MITYDRAKKELSFLKVAEEPADYHYKKSDMKESYEKYIFNTLEKDIREVLIPKMNEAMGGSEEAPVVWLESLRVAYDNTVNHVGDEFYSTFVKLGSPNFVNGTKEFCIFKIPMMTDDGVIRFRKKKYACFSEIVQDDDITFTSDKGLKVITDASYVRVSRGTKGIDVNCPSYKNKGKSAATIMLALAHEEGRDGVELFKMLRADELVNIFKSDDDLKLSSIYAFNMCSTDDGPLTRFKQPNYALTSVRDRLNSVLSIDRALGKTLSRSITLSSGDVVEAETVVTTSLLRKLKHDKVNCVYVRRIPNKQGMYLAESISIPILRSGTEIIDCIKERFPELSSQMYIKNDMYIDMEEPFFLWEGTEVTPGLLDMLAYNGYDEVRLKASPARSAASIVVPLETEIIGNNTYLKKDIGLAGDGWVSINAKGEYEECSNYLTAYDFLALMSLDVVLERGEDLDYIADVDLSFRKKIKMFNETYHDAFVKVCPEYFKMMSRALRELYDKNVQQLNVPDYMEAKLYKLSEDVWREARERNMIRPMEMKNPLDFHSSLTKVVTAVKNDNSISDSQRRLTMGHYGRIDPYESPSSKRLGITNNFAVSCKINDKGLPTTPYYRVKHVGNTHIVSNKVEYLTIQEEEQFKIGDIASVKMDANRVITSTDRVLARVPAINSLEKMMVAYVDIAYLDYVCTNPNQILSWTTSSIPFIGADDAARIALGQSMAKQAKPLVYREAPIVLTSAYKNIMRQSTFYSIHAEEDGTVLEAEEGFIVVLYDSGITKTFEYLVTEFVTDAVILRFLNCKAGDRFKAGDYLMTSNYMQDDYLAIGKNVLIGYNPVRCYNYEDGVYMAKSLAEDFTSYGTEHEKEPIPKKVNSTNVLPAQHFRYKSRGSILYNVVHSNRNHKTRVPIRSRRIKGFIIDVGKEQDNMSNRDSNTYGRTVSLDLLQNGDKVANRHGNKGVVPRLEDDSKMPRLANGINLKVVYNPHGVGSRMNIGQILECNTGLAGYVLGVRIYTPSFNGATTEEIKRLLSYTWHMANDDDWKSVRNMFPEYPKEFLDDCEANIDRIRFWKNCFSELGNAMMFNPLTGKYYETSMVVGINYIYKLVQEVEHKVHARAGLLSEPYVDKDDAPTKSAAKLGGQRFGSMEGDALSAYGVSKYMQELYNARGDNSVARNNLHVSKLHKGSKYLIEKSYGMRRSTEKFLMLMAALGVHTEFTNGELPNIDKNYTDNKYTYSQGTLLKATETSASKDKEIISRSEYSDILGKS